MRIYSDEDCIRAQNGTECINCGDCRCEHCNELEWACICCQGRECHTCDNDCECTDCGELTRECTCG